MLRLFLTTLLFSTSAFAADFYVSTSGSDSNAGTQSAPFRTIQKAANVAAAGTTVHVAPGTYNENITSNKSGTSSARIRFVSDATWGAKIIGSGTESIWTNSGDYVDIVGFDMTGTTRLGILNLGSFNLVSKNHIHNLTVSGGCTSNGGAGIDHGDYTKSDNDTIGNVVHDIGIPGSCNGVQGIYHANLRGHIYNNVVYRVSAFGIHLWHAANQVTIMNNTLFNNGSANIGGGMVLGNGDAPGGIVLDNTIVANNIVYKNAFFGISEYCYTGENCIGPNVKVTNNLVYGNGLNLDMQVGSASNTISSDPLFVNFTGGDYHLQSTSPAIDQGVSNLAPALDFDDIPRPQGAGVDIGAYEYLSQSTPSPTPSASLTVSSTQVAPGGPISVNISGSGLSNQAYAALYLASAADADYAYQGNWLYLNGTQTQPSTPINSGTLKFVAPQEVGTYNIRVFSTDAGTPGARLAISPNIQVVAATTDTTAPTTSITAPINGATPYRGTKVTISADASDNVGVSKVEFYVNGNLKCTNTTANGSCIFTTANRRGVYYKLQTKAYDAAGNVGASSIVTIRTR